MPDYQWTLCKSPTNAAPFAELVKIGDLHQAKNRTFQLVKNRAGTANFSIRTNDDMAYAILDGVNLNDIRGTVNKCIRIRRNGTDLWSGQIWGIQGDLDQGTIQISCVGWLEPLQYAMLWQTADYSNAGVGTASDTIAFGLITLINAQDLAHPLKVKAGTVTGVMPVRNRYYTFGQMLGPALQELSDIEAGFDMNVDPVTRELNLSAWNLFSNRTNVILGYNWGPNNLKNATWQEDASKTVNKMYVQSLGAPVGPIVDVPSQDKYGNFENQTTLTGANQSVLAPYAEAELVIRSRPLVTWSVIPRPRTDTDEGAPSLFDDFDIGDQIYFSARKDAVKIDRQAIRVFGATVALDDNDTETVTGLQLTASGVV